MLKCQIITITINHLYSKFSIRIGQKVMNSTEFGCGLDLIRLCKNSGPLSYSKFIKVFTSNIYCIIAEF